MVFVAARMSFTFRVRSEPVRVLSPLLQLPGAHIKLIPVTNPVSLYIVGVMLRVTSFWS